jgi:hypothetical protein
MKNFVGPCLIAILTVTLLAAQEAGNKMPSKSTPADDHTLTPADSDDLQQLNADLQRMKILLNQMRTNLAFVQTSQTPLKHQFEIEADAWQVMVEQMDRRIKRMERARTGDSDKEPAMHAKLASGR